MSLRDYHDQRRRPVLVISSAAQAAAVVQQVCQQGEMLRLINSRQLSQQEMLKPFGTQRETNQVESNSIGVSGNAFKDVCLNSFAFLL